MSTASDPVLVFESSRFPAAGAVDSPNDDEVFPGMPLLASILDRALPIIGDDVSARLTAPAPESMGCRTYVRLAGGRVGVHLGLWLDVGLSESYSGTWTIQTWRSGLTVRALLPRWLDSIELPTWLCREGPEFEGPIAVQGAIWHVLKSHADEFSQVRAYQGLPE